MQHMKDFWNWLPDFFQSILFLGGFSLIFIAIGTLSKRIWSGGRFLHRSTKSIIGNPQRLSGIEIAQRDLPNWKDWWDAKKACESLGPGWRLPSIKEWSEIYIHKDRLGSFENCEYLSSDKSTVFIRGRQLYSKPQIRRPVRAVRDYKLNT